MNISTVLAIGAAAASVGAQPAKDASPAKTPATAATAPVVLASASDAQPADVHATQPVRRPAPRVTTCRCGDPQPEDNQPEQ
jgi:hypothetical protein